MIPREQLISNFFPTFHVKGPVQNRYVPIRERQSTNDAHSFSATKADTSWRWMQCSRLARSVHSKERSGNALLTVVMLHVILCYCLLLWKYKNTLSLLSRSLFSTRMSIIIYHRLIWRQLNRRKIIKHAFPTATLEEITKSVISLLLNSIYILSLGVENSIDSLRNRQRFWTKLLWFIIIALVY